jgi:S-adenosylmethionine:tRNA ribosyltransferase-isomerase
VRELALGRVGRNERLDQALVLVCAVVLEPFEPRIDTAPTRAHEIDEQREVVDACVSLGEEVALDSLEPTDRLVQQAADLGDVACDGEDFSTNAVTDSRAHTLWDGGLELGCGGRKRLDLAPRALERCIDRAGRGATRRGVCDPLLRALECEGVHGRRGYSQRRMDMDLLEYDLPPDLIAQTPIEPRDASRLLVYRRASGEISHRTVADLPELLSGELVVVNDTRVVPARLHARRETGGAVEVLLLEQVDGNGTWEALVRPSRRLRAGEEVGLVRLREALGDGRWLVDVRGRPVGEMPLPPYIHEPLADPERYQTVYGAVEGSAAAPTAGLHLTPALVAALEPARVTLHVGLDTFRPVAEARLDEHVLHGERYSVESSAWECIAAAERVLAVGTTTVRVLETVVRSGELEGRTTLFVTPGFEFRQVDALLTNFHLPRSTLLALVMAFAGVHATRAIYEEAVAERYRFYSFGDAMLVL